MSETQTIAQPVSSKRLALADLRSTRWVSTQPAVKSTYDALKSRYLTLRKTPIIGWIVVFYEMVAVWWWSFLHNLPWPQQLLALVEWADNIAVQFLDYAQQKLEWWWDAMGVRAMWLKESLLAALDRYITTIDSYLLRFQDAVIALIYFLLRPVLAMYKVLTTPARPKVQQEQHQHKSGLNGLAGEGRARHRSDMESDVAEDDDTEEYGNDYLSDASTDSRRLLSSGPQGAQYNRQCTRGTAEGRLRAAMYLRVKNELRVMRRNSIRFSYGIVNYAKQVMAPRVRPYAVSFQDYYQKWAREFEIQELMTPLQEEWNSEKRPLGKVLALAQALCVACLAFLLRLAKGKKSRRTRSMRSGSLRRRTQNLACSTSPLPLSPSALQQSSEPATTPTMEVPPSLQEAALKEEDEDLDGLQAKDSALGSELDNPSDHQESDHAITPIYEEHESDQEFQTHTKDTHASETSTTYLPPTNEKTKYEDAYQGEMRQNKKGVTIINSTAQKTHKKSNKVLNKKNVTLSYNGNVVG